MNVDNGIVQNLFAGSNLEIWVKHIKNNDITFSAVIFFTYRIIVSFCYHLPKSK